MFISIACSKKAGFLIQNVFSKLITSNVAALPHLDAMSRIQGNRPVKILDGGGEDEEWGKRQCRIHHLDVEITELF